MDADGDVLTYTITGGADMSQFNIAEATGVLTFKISPDAERPRGMPFNAATNTNSYEVIVTVTGGANSAAQTITVTVTDVNEDLPDIINIIGADVTVPENTVAAYALEGGYGYTHNKLYFSYFSNFTA